MRAPSVKLLTDTFRDLTCDDAELIRQLARTRDDREALRTLIDARCPATASHIRRCFGDPYETTSYRTAIVLYAVDRILGTHGVEALGRKEFAPPLFEYCNMGDPHVFTLIYRRDEDRLFVGSYGNIVEKLDDGEAD